MQFWKVAVVGGLFAALVKGAQYLNLAKNLEFVPKVRVHSISLSQIKVAVDLTIINPTRSQASFTKPFVGLYLNDKLLGYQAAGTKITRIKPQGTTQSTIILTVPYSLELLKLLNAKSQVRVDLLSYVDNKEVKLSQKISLSGLEGLQFPNNQYTLTGGNIH